MEEISITLLPPDDDHSASGPSLVVLNSLCALLLLLSFLYSAANRRYDGKRCVYSLFGRRLRWNFEAVVGCFLGSVPLLVIALSFWGPLFRDWSDVHPFAAFVILNAAFIWAVISFLPLVAAYLFGLGICLEFSVLVMIFGLDLDSVPDSIKGMLAMLAVLSPPIPCIALCCKRRTSGLFFVYLGSLMAFGSFLSIRTGWDTGDEKGHYWKLAFGTALTTAIALAAFHVQRRHKGIPEMQWKDRY